MFEAGIRAVLGQQISVAAAHTLVTRLVENLGEQGGEGSLYFPTPAAIASCDFGFFNMPESRKQTLRNLAQHYLTSPLPDNPQAWLALKGIGPWTVGYARMRGLSEPDIFLASDLGVKKALINMSADVNAQQASPWRSYLTFQLWSQ